MEEPLVRVRAPGRVNLMGGHSDYTGGLVLPMAVDLATSVVGRRESSMVRLHSADEREDAVVPTSVPAERAGTMEPAWARYVAAVVVETGLRVGFEGEVRTTIPIGAGLSSSAALEVAVALALGADDDGTADRPALAEVLRTAEHRASGVPCGVMDQLASLCGVEGHALLLDCSSLAVTPVAMPDGAEWVVVPSGQARSLRSVPYAERRDETVAAAALLGGFGAPQHATATEAEAVDDPVLRRRARHLVSECARVRAVVEALAADDLAGAGTLMLESHRSLRDDQDVTTPVLDELVDHLAATPGVHGARLTGGGWGGAVLALAEVGALATVGTVVHPAAGATVTIDPDD